LRFILNTKDPCLAENRGSNMSLFIIPDGELWIWI